MLKIVETDIDLFFDVFSKEKSTLNCKIHGRKMKTHLRNHNVQLEIFS